MPKSKLAKIGVWEKGKFVGALVYGVGSNNQMARSMGLSITECCELVRVALRRHDTPVTRIVSISLKMLRRQSPGLKCVVSYSDPAQGHVGAIYQAGNWLYMGRTQPVDYYKDKRGKLHHWRDARRMQARGVPLEKVYLPGKHKYAMPLDEDVRRRLSCIAGTYPKKTCAGSVEGDAFATQAEEGGSIPTPAL